MLVLFRGRRKEALMHNRRSGFTLIELLIVVVIIGILAAIAIPKMSATKAQAYVAQMRGDLHNLASAQEVYSGDAGSYYGGAVPSAALLYNPSSGVTMNIVQATAAGWSAVASAPGLTPRICALYVGNVPAVAPATAQGLITCTP
jgi:type IV pilus assembly protein PilA